MHGEASFFRPAIQDLDLGTRFVTGYASGIPASWLHPRRRSAAG